MSKIKLPEIYFDLRTGGFWMELNAGSYTALSGSDVKSHLQMRKVHTQIKNDEGLSYGDELLAQAQINNRVHLAGPFAGHKAGFRDLGNGKRILVTESCAPVQPGKKAHCPRTEKFIGQLLGEQSVYFLAWLKIGLESLWSGVFMPGQLLVLAGDGGCGKSFCQWLITQLFGGRSAKPYRYMTGQTQFNYDLAQAEHLAMGDVAASFDIRTRKQLAAQIKEFCVEPEISVHAKGKDATLAVETFRRLSLSVNHEPEHMLIIPPLDSDLKPKVMLLHCEKAELSSDRAENQKEFLSELPGLAARLKGWKIPAKIRDDRFGVTAYHDPELLELISDSSPEMQLLNVINEILFAPDKTVAEFWRGTAEQLKHELIQSKYHDTAAGLLSKWPAATGAYLARLKSKFPARFEMRRSQGKQSWFIRPPTAD